MKKYSILLLIIILFFSCENDTSSPEDNSTQMGLDGVVQKGPFVTGSTIIVQELNDEFSPNGVSFNVTTEDNFGSFTLNSEISTDFVEIISTGFYFNEVTGDLSSANLTLRALSPVADSLKCNINILTTLAEKRIVYLVNREWMSYNEAKKQAQDELLKIFSVHEADVEDFEKMDISQGNVSDAILLAVSVVLQESNSVSQLSVLISNIIDDIQLDGTLDSYVLGNEIYYNAKRLNLTNVRNNIEAYYDTLDVSLTVPDFEKHVNDMWKKQCTIVEPNNNQSFNYNDSMSVNIDDFASYINIINTKYYIDGQLIADDSSYPYSNSYKLENLDFGDHLLKAVATDDSSNVYADSINIVVNTPDLFTLTSPVEGEIFNSGDTVSIEISDNPDYINVTNVKYYFDDVLITDIDQKQLNYDYILNDPETPGEHEIKTVVTDETGRVEADSLNIIVNALPTISITKLECVQTMGTESSTVSAMEGNPLIIGSEASIEVSSNDTDGTISKVEIYLDNILVDDTSMGNYSWTITDTTKYHTVKVVVFDNEGVTSKDSINYELYGSKWVFKTLEFPVGNSEGITDFISYNGEIYAFDVAGKTYSSQNGSEWLVSTSNYLNNPALLDTVFQDKIWATSPLDIFSNSSDGITWNDLNIYVPPTDIPLALNTEGAKLLLHNNIIWCLVWNMDNGLGELHKVRNDSLVFHETNTLDFTYNKGVYSEVVEIDNELFIYKCDGTQQAFRSSNMTDWILEENIAPFDNTIPDYLTHLNPKTPNIVKLDEIIYAITNSGELWTSVDGYNWEKEILLSPQNGKDLFIYNGNLWLFSAENSSVYYLKKYFD